MAKLNKYNLAGESIGHVEVDDLLVNAEANGQMVKDYIVAIRANARQWSASTKTRAEVKHTTKKCQPQKGQGRARHGSLVAPQYRGGGRAFGPRPKFDQHIRINQKERQAAIRALLGEKFRKNKIWVIDSTEMEEPKTKVIDQFINQHNMRRVLFLGDTDMAEFQFEQEIYRFSISSDKHDVFKLSLRNIPNADFKLASNISGYDVMVAHEIVVTESALIELNEWLNGKE